MDLDLLAPTGVFSTARARAVGLGRADLRRLLRTGQVTHLHHGWYAVGPKPDAARFHGLRVTAALAEYAGSAVATGASALLRLDLPTFRPDLRRVHLELLDPLRYRHRTPDLVVHAASPVSRSLGTTAVATVHPALAAVEAGLGEARSFLVPADAALRRSLATMADLSSAVEAAAGRRGVGTLRAVVDQVDGRHESPGETITSYVLRLLGHQLVPQFVVPGTEPWTPGGRGYRADFGIVGTRVLVEFDGRVKYASRQDLWDEKQREDRIRALGWEVVRLTWADLRQPTAVAARIAAARARATAPASSSAERHPGQREVTDSGTDR